eukprot:762163-Hanusia_phi.AAC.4
MRSKHVGEAKLVSSAAMLPHPIGESRAVSELRNSVACAARMPVRVTCALPLRKSRTVHHSVI